MTLALRTYEVLGCEGAARVDFRITPRGRPVVLEINTAPGMTETSLLPMAAARAEIDYDELTERILESALVRAAASTVRQGKGACHEGVFAKESMPAIGPRLNQWKGARASQILDQRQQARREKTRLAVDDVRCAWGNGLSVLRCWLGG